MVFFLKKSVQVTMINLFSGVKLKSNKVKDFGY